ncbi:hypothetical protein VIMS_02471 [Mycobacterium marinum]|uniref:hypothetical protein n=1 Tax=Mycobacterium marinum TaxID=1781 RepID=UPI000E3D4856|nr:hypothetical protein [Mycobacterium marinum]RFZ15041.1 hypothetical protein VIMS_02471 [Mycobacterium marinum]
MTTDATNPDLPIRNHLSESQHAVETLAALDWGTYQCQCEHHHKCAERAVVVVYIHAIDNCNLPGLDPFGNRVEIRCGPCLQKLRAHVAESLERLKPFGRPACEGCGAPLATVGDVIRGVVTLRALP